MLKSALVVAVCGLAALEAAACSCVPCEGSRLTEMRDVDSIFAADVLAARQVGPNKKTEGRIWMEYTMQPVEVLKGAPGKTVIVRSAWSGAECGVEFKVNTRAAVAAQKNGDGVLTASLCTQMCWANPENKALFTLKTVE